MRIIIRSWDATSSLRTNNFSANTRSEPWNCTLIRTPIIPKLFQKLQAAKDVLLDSEKRRKYDKWRKSGLMMPFQQYLNLNITSLHWVTKKTKEPMLTESAHQCSTTGMKSCEPQGSLSSWRKEEPASELLKKFRNYEI
ncbi:dnaJ homolog subfamily C member 12 isoform X2 [Ixodes scapularis]|uniref:dnaJ homolog subfamily C member 12 isoform X2 n=1 Tax=Ixodes scapularis TaxID=6945 RepID=UPI001AD7C933|nr:dnaJ homolog subfamily C member 12 isoform X2 [Ixodes scapularis]